MSEALEEACADVYRQVWRLWLALEDTLPTWDYKFSILYGPPVEAPPMFVIGLNPGGGPDQELETTWPESFWYAQDREHRLPRRLQDIFDRAACRAAFNCSTGANLIFFRTPQIAKNAEETGWNNVPLALRRPLESYCRQQLQRLIDLMQPRLLFLMGWDALDQIAPSKNYVDKLVLNGKWLAVQSFAGMRPVIGIRHPTGARWSTEDVNAVGDWLARKLPGLIKPT